MKKACYFAILKAKQYLRIEFRKENNNLLSSFARKITIDYQILKGK